LRCGAGDASRGSAVIALAFARYRSIEIGIKRVGEFAASGFFARDLQTDLVESFAIAHHERFPGALVSVSAGTGKNQLFDLEGNTKFAQLSRAGCAGMFPRYFGEDARQLLATEAELFGSALGMEFGGQSLELGREAGGGLRGAIHPEFPVFRDATHFFQCKEE